MNRELEIGARRAKAFHFGDDDRQVVDASLSNGTRRPAGNALVERDARAPAFEREAARAANFAASAAGWRRLATFAKEISQ
jgi:hypothetical protein